MTATLMLLAIAARAVPTLASELHTPASGHIGALDIACAIVLLAVFGSSIPFLLKGDPAVSSKRTPDEGKERFTCVNCDATVVLFLRGISRNERVLRDRFYDRTIADCPEHGHAREIRCHGVLSSQYPRGFITAAYLHRTFSKLTSWSRAVTAQLRLRATTDRSGISGRRDAAGRVGL